MSLFGSSIISDHFLISIHPAAGQLEGLRTWFHSATAVVVSVCGYTSLADYLVELKSDRRYFLFWETMSLGMKRGFLSNKKVSKSALKGDKNLVPGSIVNAL
jgi:hypothetical protein